MRVSNKFCESASLRLWQRLRGLEIKQGILTQPSTVNPAPLLRTIRLAVVPHLRQAVRSMGIGEKIDCLGQFALLDFSILNLGLMLGAAALHAIRYAQHHSRSHDAVIRVYDTAGKGDRNARACG